MKRIRRAGTSPELAVQGALRELGLRFRTTVATLPGTPDIANKRHRWVVFVHGCFWHGHRGCRLFTKPKTNTSFWASKVVANRARDRRKTKALQVLGYTVLVVWQCQTKQRASLLARLSPICEL